ncbi:hypothetical protein GDO78_020293 [Eleutherodactylus coqui]|uniref:Uncharacterized protein n=1 Tax=Eleutherodactylus coqui TaxID=57060 RepID=A0A8J6E5V1_ELECQ|nr:hypothetical protein GDO78_020293 [Eleutherodactylus coqui]
MSLHDLEAQLVQMWSDMLKDTIQNLYASIHTLITSCIKARGSTTRYYSLHAPHIPSCIQARSGTTGY